MTEYFRITGLNTIPFDSEVTGHVDHRYRLVRGESPKGIDEPLTKEQAIPHLRNLPTEIASHILGRPGEHVMSIITFPFSIQGADDADMEDAEHDLRETLEDGKLYIKTRGARGTEAILQVKSDNAVAQSYKTIFWGEFTEDAGREILGAAIKESYIRSLQMRLYCEPYWHPSSATNLVNAQTLYNHDDTDANHDNYVDIVAANIAGDVPAKTKLLIKDLNMGNIKFAYVARRSQGTVANFDHWIEAEAMAASNWASVGDTDRSNGNIRSDSANASGNASIVISANLDDHKGRLGVYASLWTDDIVNTSFRFSWQFAAPTPTYYSGWKWITKASTWQVVKLGQLIFDSHLYPDGDTLASWQMFVEYQKDAADTAKFDYVMLLPEDESVIMIDAAHPIDYATARDTFEIDNIRDFPAAYVIASATGDFEALVGIKGGNLTLQPNDTNRLYFKMFVVDGDTDPFDQHSDDIDNDGAPAQRFEVTLDYLPQFISPLE